jgi:hypothetical protein
VLLAGREGMVAQAGVAKELVNGDGRVAKPFPLRDGPREPVIGKIHEREVQGDEHGWDVTREHVVIHPQDAQPLDVPEAHGNGARQPVDGHVEVRERLQVAHARGDAARQLVVVEGELRQLRQLPDQRGDLAVQLVRVQVELLEAREPVERVGDGARKLAAAEIQVLKARANLAKLRRNRSRKPNRCFHVDIHLLALWKNDERKKESVLVTLNGLIKGPISKTSHWDPLLGL